LIDACLPRALAAPERGFDCLYAYDHLGDGAPDRAVLRLAEAQSRVIVTADIKDFSRLAPGSLHPATVLVDLSSDPYITIDNAVKGMREVAALLANDVDLQGCIVRVRPKGRVAVYRPPPS
jgi:hypothetical protein